MFDVQGREIDVLLKEYLTEGKYRITYQPKSIMNGMYTLMLTTGRERLHQSCIILK
jgi:hypothetical protein